MVKTPNKPPVNGKTPLNYTSNTLKEYSQPTKKSIQQLNKEHYQKNKERIKKRQQERYQQQKEQAQQQLSKYYGAEAIKVLMSFKDYTELNPAKKQLWLDFNWTLQDCQRSFKEGYADIVAIMKLEQVAHKLVRDYWDTAKSEERQKGKSWNSLDYDEQQRLIKYWGYEKARIENNYLTEEERLEKQSKEYLKEIELAKFHEERGKIKCSCYSCEQKAVIRKEVQTKIKKEEREAVKFWKEQERKWRGAEKDSGETEWKRGECAGCYEEKRVSVESGLCRKCEREAEGRYSLD